MKQFFTFLLLATLGLFSLAGCQTQRVPVRGPEGELAYKISWPEGFDPNTDRCPMVILMHGIFSSKDYGPMPQLAKGLAEAGIASIRFDFDGHGNSEGRKKDMTIEKELADARAIWDYVQTLPYVSEVGLLGHSQGGVIASMSAGRLADENTAPSGVVLIAPGSVIKDACQAGTFFNAKFDPKNPPEFIRCWGIYKLGREYLTSTQQLNIYGAAATYEGPVLLLHGNRDNIVPMWCSEKYLEAYGDNATLEVIDGENHTITKRRKQVIEQTVTFFKNIFKQQ